MAPSRIIRKWIPSNRGRHAFAGFLVAIVVAELVARLVMTTTTESIRWYDAAAQLKIEQMDALEDTDVVFAGTSMAWQAFDAPAYTDATGDSSYNAGLNGGTPEVMERWLLEEVVPRTGPGTVVWGLSSLDLAPNYGPTQRAAYDEALATKPGLLAGLERRLAERSSLVANRTVLRSFGDVNGAAADERKASVASARATLGAGGERLDFTLALDDQRRGVMTARLRDYDAGATDAARIAGVIESLQARGINVVLVHLPTPARMIETLPRQETDHVATIVAIAEIASRADVRFLELSRSIADDGFVDFSHLNVAGVATFTSRLIDDLGSGRDDRGLATSLVIPEWNPATIAQTDEPDCVVEVVVDDYGFELEISSCDGNAEEVPAADRDGQLLAVAAVVAPEVLTAVETRNESCTAAKSPLAGLQSIAASIDASTDAAAGSESEGKALLMATVLQLVDRPSTCTPSSDPAVASATAAIASALDRLAAIIADKPESASEIWDTDDVLRTAIWIRHALDTGQRIDGIVVGNSVSLSGIDALLVGDGIGETIGQASISGVTPEAIGGWLDEIVPLVDPQRVYWGISFFDVYALCYVERRAEEWSGRTDQRSGLFDDIVAAASRARWDHLLGPTGTDAYGESPILATIDVPYFTAALGQGPLGDRTAVDADALARSVAALDTLSWQPAELCRGRAESLRSEVEQLQADGREVVLVVLPPNPDFASEHPRGFDGYFDDAAALVAGAGADQVITIDIGLSPADFVDGVHFLTKTRPAIAKVIVDSLAGRD